MRKFGQDRPTGKQLKLHIEAMILGGGLRAGQNMPATREIAMNYKVNPVIVNDTLRVLLAEGILEFNRASGIRVAARAMELIEANSKGDSTFGGEPAKRSAAALRPVSKQLSWC